MNQRQAVLTVMTILAVGLAFADTTANATAAGQKRTQFREQQHAAVQAHRQQQRQENVAFRDQLHDQNKAKLTESMAKNKKLTQVQKDELLKFYDDQYQENKTFNEEHYQAGLDNFKKIANDPNMTQEQKKAALKAFRDQQKESAKTFREKQKTERKAERGQIKSPAATPNAQ